MSTHSPHITALHSRFAKEIPYRPWTRVYDAWFIGRRDADAGLAHTVTPGDQPSVSLREMRSLHEHRCELERLTATRIAAPMLDRRRELAQVSDYLMIEHAELSAELAAAAKMPADALTTIPKAEAHLTHEQRAGRRVREHSARLAPLRARLTGVQREQIATRAALADLDGKLTTLFEGLQARVSALTRYYERRCTHQIRAYLRRVSMTDGAAHPLNTRAQIAEPAWATAENPWLRPLDDYRSRVDNARTEEAGRPDAS